MDPARNAPPVRVSATPQLCRRPGIAASGLVLVVLGAAGRAEDGPPPAPGAGWQVTLRDGGRLIGAVEPAAFTWRRIGGSGELQDATLPIDRLDAAEWVAVPGTRELAKVPPLIADLGGPSYARREAAMEVLAEQGSSGRAMLEYVLSRTPSWEIRWRLSRLLETMPRAGGPELPFDRVRLRPRGSAGTAGDAGATGPEADEQRGEWLDESLTFVWRGQRLTLGRARLARLERLTGPVATLRPDRAWLARPPSEPASPRPGPAPAARAPTRRG